MPAPGVEPFCGTGLPPAEGRFGARRATAEWIAADGRRAGPEDVDVIHEDVLTIEVADVGAYALMWTPTTDTFRAVGYTLADGILADDGIPEPLALAAGFVFTEGIVEKLEDIAEMSVCPERPDVVRMRLVRPEGVAVRRRNVVVNSACGVCGGRERLRDDALRAAPVTDRLRMSVAAFEPIRMALQAHQGIFGRTGGAHGVVLFGPGLEVLAVAEDLGRHNALDKVIGQRFLAGHGFAGCGVFITSRVSYEMMAKAARAGCEIVAAISAPTSLAIEMADRLDITLCAFVRGDSARVYTHPRRIVDA